MAKAKSKPDGPERISTVEELHDYLNVTSVRLWVFLGVIMALIVGAIAFASTITMVNTAKVKADVMMVDEKDKERWMLVTIDIPQEVEEIVEAGMPVTIGNEHGTIEYVDSSVEDGVWGRVVLDDDSVILPEGTYDALVYIETATPLSYLFN